MHVPRYLVKMPEEAMWLAWIGSLTALVTAVMLYAGAEKEITGAVAGFVAVTGRLVTGMLLPTPSRAEAVAEVRANTEAAPK